MNENVLRTILKMQGIFICSLIINTSKGAKIIHFGTPKELIATLREAIKNDHLLASASADVVDQLLMKPFPIQDAEFVEKE